VILPTTYSRLGAFERPVGMYPERTQRDFGVHKIARNALFCWSERRDLNSGPPVPQTGALTGLRYAPTEAETINSMAIGRNTLRDMPMKSRMLLAMRKLTS
jgi:hypothetical protein